MNPFRVMHSAHDTGVLLDALWALSEELPARQIKLVAFHLAQQKVMFRSDNFTVDAMPDLARAINELQPSLVDVSVLARPRGEVDIVESLANTEALAAQVPDAVIFLGPKVMYTERLPAGRLDLPPAIPRFFYVQCAASPFRAVGRSVRMQAPDFRNPRPDIPVSEGLPDLIENIVARMKGKTLNAGSARGVRQGCFRHKECDLYSRTRMHVLPGSAAIAITLALSCHAQVDIEPRPRRPRPDAPRPNLRVDTNMVLVPVSVTNPMNRSVTGLEPENFRLFDNGLEQSISRFSNEERAVAGLRFCSTPAAAWAKSWTALGPPPGRFPRRLTPGMNSAWSPSTAPQDAYTPLTHDIGDVENKILFSRSHGSTALLDAILLGLSEIRKSKRNKRLC